MLWPQALHSISNCVLGNLDYWTYGLKGKAGKLCWSSNHLSTYKINKQKMYFCYCKLFLGYIFDILTFTFRCIPTNYFCYFYSSNNKQTTQIFPLLHLHPILSYYIILEDSLSLKWNTRPKIRPRKDFIMIDQAWAVI